MKKVMAILLFLVLAVTIAACDKDEEAEFAVLEKATAANTNYGILQPLLDTYGFPFELRYTQGMELTNIIVYETYAKREWHTDQDNMTHDELTWNLTGNTMEISGGWNENFTLDMDRGVAVSLTDGIEYRMVVHLPDSIDTRWYVVWPTDEGFTEIDGVRYDTAADDFGNALYLCQFVKDCLAEPDSFQIHGLSHLEEDGHYAYYLDFSHEVKNGEMERTHYFAEFVGSTLLCIVNENSSLYCQTEGDYMAKYPALSAVFQKNSAELLDVDYIITNLK